MIGPSGTVRVMVATKPVDFRKGMEGLAMLVREHMKADPFWGVVYVFRAKRADRIPSYSFFGKAPKSGLHREKQGEEPTGSEASNNRYSRSDCVTKGLTASKRNGAS